jgi:hypothetical protein
MIAWRDRPAPFGPGAQMHSEGMAQRMRGDGLVDVALQPYLAAGAIDGKRRDRPTGIATGTGEPNDLCDIHARQRHRPDGNAYPADERRCDHKPTWPRDAEKNDFHKSFFASVN